MTAQHFLRIIAARGRSGQIGRGNSLLWNLPADMRLFRERTTGNVLLMGRKTWDSIGGKPLKGRTAVILSRTAQPDREGVFWTTTFDDALALTATLAGDGQLPFCIGGAELYRLALPHAAELLLTDVDDDPPADAYFPDFSAADWREAESFDLGTMPAARFRRLVRA